MKHTTLIRLLISCCFVLTFVQAQQRKNRAPQKRKASQQVERPAETPAPSPSVIPPPTATPSPTPRPAAPGDLDPSFGKDGMVTTTIGSIANANSIAIQSDGKIVVAGAAHPDSNWDIAVVRYNANGSLDTTFDGDGIVTTDNGVSNDSALSVAVQSDGKIVAAGYSDKNHDKDIAVARYNANGSLDKTFDGDGIVTTDSGDNGSDEARSVAIQPDGKIVVAGYAKLGARVMFVVRYNPDGSLDKTFSADGKETSFMDPFPRSNTYFEASSLAIQRDGKIVVAGSSTNSSCEDGCVVVVRLATNGLNDTSFGNYGISTSGRGSAPGLHRRSEGNAMAIQPDGKIVVAASTTWLDNDIGLLRFDSNGSPDRSFGKDGIVTSDISPKYGAVGSVAIQSDGRIIVGGHTNDGTTNAFALVRYTSNGSLDSSWGQNGIVTTNFGGQTRAFTVAIQSDGRVIAAGHKYTEFAVARYLNPSPSGGK